MLQVIPEKEAQIIALRESAKTQLAQIKDIDQGVDYLNKIKALEAYAKATKQDAEMLLIMQEQKLRSMRILGRLLDETEFDKGGGTGVNQYNKETAAGSYEKPAAKPSLSDFGISKKESWTYQQIASIPEPVFEQEIEQVRQAASTAAELTISNMVSVAKQVKREQAVNEMRTAPKAELPANITLLEGDLFDLIDQIPDDGIDLLNTDPPYMVLGDDWDQFDSKEAFLEFTERWLIAVMPKVKKSGRVYVSFAQWYQYEFWEILKRNDFFGFTFKQNLIWYYKNNNQPSNRKEYRYMYEPIFYLYGPEAPALNFTPDTYGETQQNVWEIATPQSNFKEGKFHSAQKPVELYRRIIKTGSRDGETVLDCFAGSGTTGVVCKDEKRNCILIERDQDNINVIKSRLV